MRVYYKEPNLIWRKEEYLLRKGHLYWDITKRKKEKEGKRKERKQEKGKKIQVSDLANFVRRYSCQE